MTGVKRSIRSERSTGLRRRTFGALAAIAVVVGLAQAPAGAETFTDSGVDGAWTLTITQGPSWRYPVQSATTTFRIRDRAGDGTRLRNLSLDPVFTQLYGGSCSSALPSGLPDGGSFTFSCTVPPQPDGTLLPVAVMVRADVVKGLFARVVVPHDYARVWRYITWTWNT